MRNDFSIWNSRRAGDGFLGLGDLFVDAAQGASARSARYW
jgi:hypothetical protein